MGKRKPQYTLGSENIFADLGLDDAEEHLGKAELALQIVEIIRQRHLTQVKAAEILRLDQPKVSALLRGRFDGFSIERLFRLLTLLGRDLQINVNPSYEPTGKVTISGAGFNGYKASTFGHGRQVQGPRFETVFNTFFTPFGVSTFPRQVRIEKTEPAMAEPLVIAQWAVSNNMSKRTSRD